VKAFDVAQAQKYWMRVHAETSLVEDSSEARLLEPVCHPGWPVWFNSYFARCQRRAFLDALPHCGDLHDRDVLEVGCGNGRWTVLLRDLGGRVRAVDLSPEAIEANRRRIPGVQFECADLLELPLPDRCVDLAVSVTVVQHVPYEAQEGAVAELARVVRPGGHALVLENTKDRGRHVFAKPSTDWIALFAAHGFKCLFARGYSYDLPLRAGRAILALGHIGRTRGNESLEIEPLQRPARLVALAYLPLVMASLLVEPFAWRLLSTKFGTHCAFVFERGA
jgi:SAM-dependent methyltransferase